eukprot:CCRYP_002818-RA/>CCRYP_002818-RA protein AED:0.03 eAED:0.03 QI:163/1/1/1/0.5/0.33/3/886/2032
MPTPLPDITDDFSAISNEHTAAMTTTSSNGPPANGEYNHNGNDSTTDMSLSTLASRVCKAIEQGDDDANLASLLDINAGRCREHIGDRRGTRRESDADGSRGNTKSCRLASCFYNLLGKNCHHLATALSEEEEEENVTYDVSVRAHLVLKALFRVSIIDWNMCSISWKAATVAVESLQFSSDSSNTSKGVMSHAEELAIIVEIRSFLSSHVLSVSSASNDMAERLQFVNQTSQRLLRLGKDIIAPLLHSNFEDKQSTDTTQWTKRRRQHSYLLPLELIPAILAAADALDDIRDEISDDLSRDENSKLNSMQTEEKGDGSEMEDLDDCSHKGNEIKQSDNPEGNTCVSDKLMTTLFGSNGQSNRNSIRSMRAEAVLPILALAIDDIGPGRMSSTVPAIEEGVVTYWNCLKHALNDAISSSIICCTDEKDCDVGLIEKCHTLKEEEKSDQGLHIIPHSDYPALIRCIFRMITCTGNTNSSMDNSENPSWESLLLRSYHAAIVTTLNTSLIRPRNNSEMDRMAILSTVESHVLLPTFTGASVSSIRSILNACTIECCASCKHNSSTTGSADVTGFSTISTPAFAVAGVVLLIMRARASSVSYSLKSYGAGFGPRSVFRIASDIVHKKASVLEERSVTGKRVEDEFGMALKVLLNLSGIEAGACPACSDPRAIDGAPSAAYEVLKCSYYDRDGTFVPRFPHVCDESTAYRCEIGLRTLSSYRRFVYSSLTHGLSLTTGKSSSMESFVADNSRTWLDAAIMLLNDTSKLDFESRGRNGKTEESTIQDSFALAAVIIVVIFCEVPSSQTDIVRTLYDGLLESASKGSCDETCSVVISTLVWSIAARDGTTSSSEVFRRKNDRQDFNMSVFQPLSSLLSRPVVSTDQNIDRFFASNEIPPLSHGTMLPIARSLVSIPSCRDCILTMAKKHMKFFTSAGSDIHSSVMLTSVFQSMPCTFAANRDGLYFAVACLCMLIERYQPSQSSMLDDCGCEALIILTDLIVLRRPSCSTFSPLLSIKVISWILAELTRSAEMSRISVWTSQRLLRASYAGLLKCFELHTDKTVSEGCRAVLRANGVFSLETASLTTNYDLVGLLRLANSLNDVVDSKDNSPKRFLKSQLLRTLLHKHRGEVSVSVEIGASSSMSEFASSDKAGGIDFDNILRTVFMKGTASIFDTNKISSDWIYTSCSEAAEQHLVDSERFYYSERGHNSPQSSCLLPDWINTKDKTKWDIPRVSNLQVEGIQQNVIFKRVVSSVCDFFVEVLLSHDLLSNDINDSQIMSDANIDKRYKLTFPEDTDLILGISMLWGKKQSTNNSQHVLFSLAGSKLCYLVDLYSRHLQQLLTTNEDKSVLAQLEITIKHALDFCKFVTLPTANHTCNERLYESLWRLYCSIADEDSSRALISLVLQKYNDAGGWAPRASTDDSIAASGVSETTFSLTSVSSHDILDEEIHFVRTSVLVSLCRSSSSGLPKVLSSAQKSSLVNLLMQSLLKLGQDLYDGFLGQSGGMRKSLFLLYVEAIERCIKNVTETIDMMPADSVYECIPSFLVLNKVTVVIWNTFCEYSLKEAFLVKATLKICVERLPALVRKIESILSQHIESNTQLMPCVVLLDRVSVYLSDPLLRMNTATKPVDHESNERGSGISDKTITKPVDGPDYPSTLLAKPTFASSDVAIWACNVALAALSTFWNESYKYAIITDRKRRVARTSPDRILIFAKHRIYYFQSVHTTICKMFEEIQRSDDNTSVKNTLNYDEDVDHGPMNGQENATDSGALLAESLTYNGKSYLCSCLEKMSIAINSSIKTVIGYLKILSRPDNSRLLGSLSCVLGCFSSVVSQSTNHDFITGPTRWFAAESKNFGTSMPDNSHKAGNYSVLHRLPKIIYRLEGIESELQNLSMIVEDIKERNNGDCKERMCILNEMASNCTPRCISGEFFHELLKDCIQIIRTRKSSLRTSETYADLLSDEEAELSDDDFSLQRRKRPRRRFASARRSLRRMPLRSRNETIDDWLTLDDEDFAAAPGEIYNVEDAFVDLEDFIVDG